MDSRSDLATGLLASGHAAIMLFQGLPSIGRGLEPAKDQMQPALITVNAEGLRVRPEDRKSSFPVEALRIP